MKVMRMNPPHTDPRMVYLKKRRNDDGDVMIHVHDGGCYKKNPNSLNVLLPSDGSRSLVTVVVMMMTLWKGGNYLINIMV